MTPEGHAAGQEHWHDFDRQVRATTDRLRSIPITRITDETLRAHRNLCLLIVRATPGVPPRVLAGLPGALPEVPVSALADQFLVVAGDFAHAARRNLGDPVASVTYPEMTRSAGDLPASDVVEEVSQGSAQATVAEVTGEIRRFRLDQLR